MGNKKMLRVGLMLAMVSTQSAWAAAAQVPRAFDDKEINTPAASQNESVLKKIAATHGANKIQPIG